MRRSWLLSTCCLPLLHAPAFLLPGGALTKVMLR